MRKPILEVGITLAVTLAAGCSTKATTESSSTSIGGVKTDVGVDDAGIHLGILTDLSGPFKSGGLALLSGAEIWADEVNAAGGICGHQIVLDTKDHGYKADSAVPLYTGMKDSVLGVIEVVGTPIIAALKSQIINDGMIASVVVTGSNTLDNDALFPVTATYDIETINGMSYFLEQGLVKEGDKVGIIYVDHEAGQNQLAGLQYFADLHGLEVVASPTSASDTDMTAVITQLKSEGVTAIVAGVAPAALGSIAITIQDQGLDIPILGGSPSFSPTHLTNEQIMSAITGNYYISGGFAPYSIDNPAGAKIRSAYAAKGTTDAPSYQINVGYVSGLVWQHVLETACESGDLTRAGVKAARTAVTSVDTGGLTGDLDLSIAGASPTRETYILQVDATKEDGLAVVGELKASDDALTYKFPNVK